MDKTQLKKIYLNCKQRCFAFMAKCFGSQSLNDTEMLTIYNDAILVLYENTKNPDFKLTCAVQTYLNSVCRNMALNEFEKQKKLFNVTDQDIENMDYDENVTDILDEVELGNPYEKALSKALNYIKEKGGLCAELLTMFWYQKASMKEIAERFGYTNAANAKNQKAKCQKRLKDIASQLLEQ